MNILVAKPFTSPYLFHKKRNSEVESVWQFLGHWVCVAKLPFSKAHANVFSLKLGTK